MSAQPQDNDFLPPAPAEQDAAALIKKVQQQLVFLEKKIDILISRSEARPASEKHFSKPFRPFGRHHRRSDRGQDSPSGERNYYPARHADRRPGEESRGFGYNKKAYDNSRESNPGREHHFKDHHGGKKKGFGKKNKPFYYKRRDRG